METGWNRSASSKSIFRSPNFFLLDRLWWRRTGSQFAVGRWSRVSCPFPTKSFVPGYGTVSRFPLPTSNNRRPLPLKSRLEKYLIQKRDATWRGILISKYKFLEIIVIYQSRGESQSNCSIHVNSPFSFSPKSFRFRFKYGRFLIASFIFRFLLFTFI